MITELKNGVKIIELGQGTTFISQAIVEDNISSGIVYSNSSSGVDNDSVIIEITDMKGSYIVFWDNDESMYKIKDKLGDTEALCEFEKYKIIGNIYEDENLLK